MPYSSYDHDKLEAAETMRIERRIYFEAKDREIAPYASLPIAQLLSMRSESAAAEQAIFDDLKERAAAWEEQAGRTLLLDKTLEYVRTPHVQHTANEWQTTEHNRHIRSNRVYQMNYYIYENTRYNQEAQKSIPYSWTLTWSVRTNSPSRGNPRLRKSNSIWREKQMMNTVRKSENLLPFPVISAAANGDTTAMCAILKHYEGYIAKLCTRTLKDDAGNTYSYVDEEMRNRLQVRLITRTLAFHVG